MTPLSGVTSVPLHRTLLLFLLIVAFALCFPIPATQAQTNDAAKRFTDAQSKYEQLGNEIVATQQQIEQGEARSDLLRRVASERALFLYKEFQSEDEETGLRDSELLDAANRSDNKAIKALKELDEQLHTWKQELERQQEEQRKARDQFDLERKKLVRVLNKPPQASSKPPSVVDGLICPVPAARFSDDYGDPRAGHTHQGNDLFAPTGTPNYAVVSGTVTTQTGGSAGNAAYLAGDDGITYAYFHLSSFGATGRVEQGAVVGYVGSTGNAAAPHTHFEMRGVGNPYPTLSRIC